jgi:uncharacterized coiled-coil DUF342 family protein
MTDYTDLCRRLRSTPITSGFHEAATAIETLLAERDKLIEQNKTLFDSALLAAQERDAAMADARRYRYVRDHDRLSFFDPDPNW